MAQRDTPFDDPTARLEAGRFGMWVFLVALGVVFASTIVGYLAVRIDNGPDFVPIDAPRPPSILFGSTLILLVSSVTMQRALRFGKSGDPRQGGMMIATTVLAIVFLAIQWIAWTDMLAANVGPTDNLYGWTFYVLTALHAAHVVGGLPPLAITTWRASKGRYGPDDHRGITYTAMYWHFLDAVWIVLYATLWIGSAR